MTNRFISEFSLARSSASPLFSAFSLRSSAHSAPLRYLFLCHCFPVLRGASTFLSGNSFSNSYFPAINGKNANITLRLSIILSNIVGAPTFSFLHAIERLQPPPAPEGCPCTNFELLTLNRFSPLTPTIPALTRRSPVSPIIPALTQNIGGGGYPLQNGPPITPLFSLVTLTICQTI